MVSSQSHIVNWSRAIRRSNGRAHAMAVLALQYLVDEINQPNVYKRVSYSQIEDALGATPSMISSAMDTLEQCELIVRDIRFEGGRNRLYVLINPDRLNEITGTQYIFADTPEKSCVYKEQYINVNNTDINNTNDSIINKNKIKGEHTGFFKDAPSKGKQRYDKLQTKVDKAKSYKLQYLSLNDAEMLWKEVKQLYRFKNGAMVGNAVAYETDQKALSVMYLDLLMGTCGNIRALRAIIENMRFTDLKRISMNLWNLFKVSEDELLGIARGGWGNSDIEFTKPAIVFCTNERAFA